MRKPPLPRDIQSLLNLKDELYLSDLLRARDPMIKQLGINISYELGSHYA